MSVAGETKVSIVTTTTARSGSASTRPVAAVSAFLAIWYARFLSRWSATLLALYALLIAACVASLIQAGDFSFGRKPWENLKSTAQELSAS